ncbi:DUF3108 domain-containing protein [Pseudoalteromonas denitrificans]|uniref:DUF3108 domain-containing protein n=1 Tax=Pseudoalteromonas denitrificans DSM 6059 TaxID=1123010 RepID=A0A1I1KYK3_9GAMM|nr:DUF3108 domain-containing protein [Pseudoalteromonas denitrificans]SFC65735.1 Protein of unknown function [Pseudoalteromonas denitrificans DSM 6059]
MQFLIIKNFLHTALTTLKKSLKNKGALTLSLSTLVIPSSFANTSTDLASDSVKEYTAKYDVLRKGERYGRATRILKKLDNNNCRISYESDIEWMIFSDKRTEISTFPCYDNHVSPKNYQMIRTGTGRDKNYKISFDRTNKQVFSNKEKFPLKLIWDDQLQDGISYQVQFRRDIKQGKTEFDYPLVDKKGRVRHYKFQVVGKETITLPFGNVETIKVKRLYDNDKRQVSVWFAPSLDYMMVRTWKGEKGVEQFDIQLKSLN